MEINIYISRELYEINIRMQKCVWCEFFLFIIKFSQHSGMCFILVYLKIIFYILFFLYLDEIYFNDLRTFRKDI